MPEVYKGGCYGILKAPGQQQAGLITLQLCYLETETEIEGENCGSCMKSNYLETIYRVYSLSGTLNCCAVIWK